MKLFKEFLIYVKDLFLEYVKSRIFPVTILFFVLTFILVHRLFYLQIQQGETYTDDLTVRTEKTLTIPSIRGNIYDRNGKLLASSRMTYNLTFGNDKQLSEEAERMGVPENVLKNQIVYHRYPGIPGRQPATGFPHSKARDRLYLYGFRGT